MKVLIVDDEILIRNVIKEYLNLENIIYDEAEDGNIAIDLCKKNNYDYLGVIGFKYDNEEEVFERVLDAGIEIVNLESEDGEIIITCNPTDIHAIKDTLESFIENIDYEIDEVGMYPKEKITLNDEDKEIFLKLYNMLDDIEDVTEIYHNVELD